MPNIDPTKAEDLLTDRCCELQERIAVLEDALRQQLPDTIITKHPRYQEWGDQYRAGIRDPDYPDWS